MYLGRGDCLSLAGSIMPSVGMPATSTYSYCGFLQVATNQSLEIIEQVARVQFASDYMFESLGFLIRFEYAAGK